ncbi:MAG: HupE/UreJ family protein [Acidobacteria bacterium]|nr:HupE/UreJ family protein [Acidobacteriota bacterium]MBI3425821.1 HupE/UreJ family protein [Acidobacteriota bacterium]
MALLIVLLTQSTTPLFAHPAPYSYLDLRVGQYAIEATLTAHTLDLAHELNVTPAEALLDPALAASKQADLLNLLRARLSLLVDGRAPALEVLRVEPAPERQALTLQLRWATSAAPGLLRVHCALFPYDPQHQTFLNVYEAGALVRQEVFSPNRGTIEHFTGSRQGTLAAIKRFISNGVYHIFAGLDHILFLVGLLLLGGSLRRLLFIVTAFTLAHSVTLTLAMLNVVNPPARVIEAAIALSIVYVGVDNLLVGATGRDVRAWIACFFGLVHGFGFANVLRDFGLPRGALGWSLFAFNVGVEIGQVCLVVIVAALLASLRQRYPALAKRVVVCGSIGVIAAGSYWFIRRVFFGG